VTQLEEPRLITYQMSGGLGEQRKAAATAAGWMRLEEVTGKGAMKRTSVGCRQLIVYMDIIPMKRTNLLVSKD